MNSEQSGLIMTGESLLHFTLADDCIVNREVHMGDDKGFVR